MVERLPEWPAELRDVSIDELDEWMRQPDRAPPEVRELLRRDYHLQRAVAAVLRRHAGLARRGRRGGPIT